MRLANTDRNLLVTLKSMKVIDIVVFTRGSYATMFMTVTVCMSVCFQSI